MTNKTPETQIGGISNYESRTQEHKEFAFTELQNLIKEYMFMDWARPCLKVMEMYKDRFLNCPGSNDKHQPWEGGYLDHLKQMMNYAVRNYDRDQVRHLPHHEQYSLSDVFVVIFLHDIEKLFKYIEPKSKMKNEYARIFMSKIDFDDYFKNNAEADRVNFITLEDGKIYVPSDKENFAEDCGIRLDDSHRIALHYVHGELYGSYDKSKRRQSPLGAAAGNADRYSARVLFNQGFDDQGKIKEYTGPNLEGQGVGTLSDVVTLHYDENKVN